MIERQTKSSGRWSVTQWELAAVLSDPQGPRSLQGPIPLGNSALNTQYMWKGLNIELYVDSAEGYWYNLLSDTPYAFVLCEYDTEDEDSIPVPVLVTVSQDEAGGHLEADNLVLSGTLPANIRDEVEKFVVENYVPETRKKRKRRDWFEESAQRGSH